MEQNTPNPYSEETTIKYNLPQTVTNASMTVYDLTGKQLATFQIEKGNTSITLTAKDLTAGIYLYSFIADGKVLDTKRMVVAGK